MRDRSAEGLPVTCVRHASVERRLSKSDRAHCLKKLSPLDHFKCLVDAGIMYYVIVSFCNVVKLQSSPGHPVETELGYFSSFNTSLLQIDDDIAKACAGLMLHHG